MREHKYRAWDKKNKKWITCLREGSNLSTFTSLGFDGEIFRFIPNKNIILVEWTGLQDENDKDIYEGDIVKLHNDIGFIKYEASMFIVACDKLPDSYARLSIFVNSELWCEGIEVIGNIHENPELLKELKKT